MFDVILSKTVKWQYAVNQPHQWKRRQLKSPKTHSVLEEPADANIVGERRSWQVEKEGMYTMCLHNWSVPTMSKSQSYG